MKKVLALVLALAMVAGFAMNTFAAADLLKAGSVDLVWNDNNKKGDGSEYKMEYTIDFEDVAAHTSAIVTAFDEYKAWKNEVKAYEAELIVAEAKGQTDRIVAINNAIDLLEAQMTVFERSEIMDLWYSISASAKSSDETYVVITDCSLKNDGEQIKVTVKYRATNTTFRTEDAKITVTFVGEDSNGRDYESKDENTVIVPQAQVGNFTAAMARNAFNRADAIEISVAQFAVIEKGAFAEMLKDSDRSITVLGIGDSRIKFDSASQNLDQDLFIGNFKTADDAEKATMTGFASTATAKVKLAVGRKFYDANYGKTLKVYDAAGNVIADAVLQGDYTVNFVAPLANLTVQQVVAAADAGKVNPSMGSNDMIGAAVALASLTLVAAGAVALKKAK